MSDEVMVPIYVMLVRAGRRTLEQVPERLRDAVTAALATEDAGTNG